MTAPTAHRRVLRASTGLARRGLLLLAFTVTISALAAQAIAVTALAAHRTAPAAPAVLPRAQAASRYPAGASRPFAHPRPGVLARSAASSAKTPKKPAKPVLSGNPARALSAYEAMQRYYYVRGSGLYEGEPFSFLWPFSQALAATVSMANVPKLPLAFAPELHARLIGLRNYLDTNNSGAPEGTFTSTLAAFDGTVAPPTGPGGAKYYDDNDWIGIELARIYKTTRNPGALGYAEGIMAFEMAGYSTDPTLACPGGIPFSNTSENTDRNTITTGPAAELGVQLYKITGNVAYLQFAETAYNWVRACLLQPNSLYADHIRQHGVIDTTFWSYNQGVMIGAGTLLYQATGNSAYLFQARQTAQAARAYFTPQRLGEENPFFPSVYFRNILYLDSVTHDPPGPKLAQAYVDYAWSHLRLSDNLFVAGSPASAQLLYQAAIVQIYALLSSPPSTYF
ncbi:MAG TPA: glycoside hydrolase family 76 protein [Solirubrobacteraceae bacterium]|nr:glycoside hydrolase family 76 protein [Solirubrobacteraceae bacterium]